MTNTKKQFLEGMEYMNRNLENCSSFEYKHEMDVETGLETVELNMQIQHIPVPKVFNLEGEEQNE
jgi:hypothetical protein